MVPSWILDILAAVMLAVSAVSAAQLLAVFRHAGGRAEADIYAAHLLMGIAMAGMLVASLSTMPAGAWEVVFGVLSAWFAWQVVGETRLQGARVLVDGHRVPHLVHSAAMLYMFLALAAPAPAAAVSGSGMGGMAGGTGTLRAPTLALVFALALAGYAVWDLDRLTGPAAAGHGYLARAAATLGSTAPATSPALAGAVAALPAVTLGGGQGAISAPAGRAAAGQARAAGPDGGPGRLIVLAPWLSTGCRIAMGVTMAFMLIIMI